MKIEYEINKCPIPIFWIDTSIIIAISRYLIGKGNEQNQETNAKKIYDFIYKKVRDNAIICPRGDQRDEVYWGREAYRNVDSILSLGIRFLGRFSIQDMQIKQFMSAYYNKEECVKLSYLDVFPEDPLTKESRFSKFFIDVDVNTIGDIKDAINRKDKMTSNLENLRKKLVLDKVRFKDQLKREYLGDFDALSIVLPQIMEKQRNREYLSITELGVIEKHIDMLKCWEEVSGNKDDFIGYNKFFLSDYYRAVPYARISSYLTATLITGNSQIESGDTMDINHASTIIPYADVFITDRKKRNLLRKLKFDKIFNCQIFCLSDSDAIIEKYK